MLSAQRFLPEPFTLAIRVIELHQYGNTNANDPTKGEYRVIILPQVLYVRYLVALGARLDTKR